MMESKGRRERYWNNIVKADPRLIESKGCADRLKSFKEPEASKTQNREKRTCERTLRRVNVPCDIPVTTDMPRRWKISTYRTLTRLKCTRLKSSQ